MSDENVLADKVDVLLVNQAMMLTVLAALVVQTKLPGAEELAAQTLKLAENVQKAFEQQLQAAE